MTNPKTIFDTKKPSIMPRKERKEWENTFTQSDTERFNQSKAIKAAIYNETEAFIERILALRSMLNRRT
jgi:hypothetical protein